MRTDSRWLSAARVGPCSSRDCDQTPRRSGRSALTSVTRWTPPVVAEAVRQWSRSRKCSDRQGTTQPEPGKSFTLAHPAVARAVARAAATVAGLSVPTARGPSRTSSATSSTTALCNRRQCSSGREPELPALAVFRPTSARRVCEKRGRSKESTLIRGRLATPAVILTG